jgi:hypothetical protein
MASSRYGSCHTALIGCCLAGVLRPLGTGLYGCLALRLKLSLACDEARSAGSAGRISPAKPCPVRPAADPASPWRPVTTTTRRAASPMAYMFEACGSCSTTFGRSAEGTLGQSCFGASDHGRVKLRPDRPSRDVPPLCARRLLLCAARAQAGLQRDGGRSAGPSGGRAACGERSESQ